MKEGHFALNCTILGNDSNFAPECVLDANICNLCLQFIESSLDKQSFTYTGSRWKFRECGSVSRRPVFHHYASSRTLQRSEAAGCPLCHEILHAPNFQANDRMVLVGRNLPAPTVEDLINNYHDECIRNYRDEWWATFEIRPLNALLKGANEEDDLEYNFMLACDESDCLQLPIQDDKEELSFPSLHSVSEGCLAKLGKWRTVCVQEHEKCPRPKLSLPTRLLDLAPVNAKPDGLQLCQSKLLLLPPEELKYVALSYCWGRESAYKTTKTNIESRLQGMSVDDLPPVMRDAIQICKSFGIRFLWVDAICILQDDNNEWNHEAARMADV